GRSTTYDEAFLLRARAIRALRAQRLGVKEIKRRTLGASTAELRAMADGATADEAHRVAGSALPAPASYPADTWERVVLLPGLELLVKSGGTPVLRRIAQEIYTNYGNRGGN